MNGELTMVERVARAICVAERMNPDDKLGGWIHWIEAALAAIREMREPNDAMRTAGGLAFEEASFEEQKMVFDAAADAWRAMIDVTLPKQP